MDHSVSPTRPPARAPRISWRWLGALLVIATASGIGAQEHLERRLEHVVEMLAQDVPRAAELAQTVRAHAERNDHQDLVALSLAYEARAASELVGLDTARELLPRAIAALPTEFFPG